LPPPPKKITGNLGNRLERSGRLPLQFLLDQDKMSRTRSKISLTVSSAMTFSWLAAILHQLHRTISRASLRGRIIAVAPPRFFLAEQRSSRKSAGNSLRLPTHLFRG